MAEIGTCAECGGPGRYTIEGVTLCTSHRGLLAKFQPLEDSRSLVEVLGDETDAIEEPMEYVAKPGDYCYFEGENIVHVDPCPLYAPGTLTDRKTGAVVGKKEI